MHYRSILAASIALTATALFSDNIAPKLTAYNENPSPENRAARERFRQRGYGLFVHYGLYSVSGFGEWQKFQDVIDTEKYRADRLPHFKPKKDCVDEWIRLAKDAGMNYIVLTARHHEGYWLGDEFIREYTAKVRAAGLGVGVYFSVADWSDPGFRAGNAKDPEGFAKFVDTSHANLKHLMRDFGKIEYLFYDGCPPPEEWDLAGINAEMRKLQPWLLICRGHRDCDFKSCEGNVNFDGAPLWEACYTFNGSWGYNQLDFNFKPLASTAAMFFSIRHNGGNFLLNVGPMADGTVQPEAAGRLRELGTWVKANHEALFGIVPHPFAYAPRELLTGGLKKKNTAYWMTSVNRVRDGRILNGIANKVTRIIYLDNGEDVPFVQDNAGLTPKLTLLKMRPRAETDLPYIMKIEFEGEPQSVFNEHLPKYSGNRKASTIEKIAANRKVIREDTFHGFDRVVFDFEGHEAWVVFPKGVPIDGNPWTWTLQWATAFVPRTNVPQMLEEGYHHVTLDTFKHRMDAEGVKVSAAFQTFLVRELGFAPKANLIGMSWGGFFSVRYAAAHPENVRRIYLDAPLLCYKKFAQGIGPWAKAAPKDGDWLAEPEMPVNQAEVLAHAGIPVLLLYGGQDLTVPPEYNAELFEKRFRAAGGDITVVKRGLFGHHPHGIELNDLTIKNFFEKETAKPVARHPGMIDAKIRVARDFRVVLLGDSIMNDSYCGGLTAIAQKAFPDTDIRFYLSVRGSTGCWYYNEKANFDEHVAKYKPNLVLIGGISNYLGPKKHTLNEAEDDMVGTIGRCKEIGAEVIICSPPPSYEFRTSPEAKPFDKSLIAEEGGMQCLQQAYERRAAERTGVAFWDLTTGPCEAIARSGKPLNWFKRDPAHNDDRGKQLIAMMFGESFRDG